MKATNIIVASIVALLLFALSQLVHSSKLLHILASFSAMGLLLLALTQACLISLQNHYLKENPTNRFLRLLPPLEAMETHLFSLLTFAFVLLSLTLGSGLWFGGVDEFVSLLPKTLLALSAWMLLVVLLAGRFFFGWRGKMAFRWTLGGVMLTLLSYFGTKLWLI